MITQETIDIFKEFNNLLVTDGDFDKPYISNHRYIHFLPELLQQLESGEDQITPESPLYAFELLDTRLRRKREYYETELPYMNNDDEVEFFEEKPKVKKKSIMHLLQLLNVSLYMNHHIQDEESHSTLMKFIIIAAASEYERAISRNKHEFAYYFQSIVENVKEINILVDPYKTRSWTKEKYNQLFEVLKLAIDNNTTDSEPSFEVLRIENVYVNVGKMIDPANPNKKEKEYFIDISAIEEKEVDKQVDNYYSPIFITNF